MSLIKNTIDNLVSEFPWLEISDITDAMIANAFYCTVDEQWSTTDEAGSVWCQCD
jgi:acyl dehydratase